MADPQLSPPIIRTKLRRPAVPADVVSRGRLIELLDAALDLPLTLISAPAGYGKSVLAAHWAESREDPCAWFSLDETDGELTGFLRYLLAAVHELFPDSCRETEELLGGPEPSPALLAGVLANELDAIETPFLLVLDDYHRLDTASEVHEWLEQLLRRPPRPLHLILVSRSDPPLPLAALRANSRLVEVRLEDLRFTAAETLSLLASTARVAVGDEALANLQRQFEGWAAGLRLAFLALRHVEDPDVFLSGLQGGFGAVQEYLVREVIEAQPPGVRDCLLKSSVLDRFCPALCDAVCASTNPSAAPAIKGGDFLGLLQEENLFCISLDSGREWFRYHHQFQALLQAELNRRCTPAEIEELHARASLWFAEQGKIEEAIHHALAAGDVPRAAQLVEQHRMAALDTDRMYVLEKWLSLLPESEIEKRPGLLLARAWIIFFRLRFPGLPALLDRIDELLGADPDPANEALSGEVDYFRGYFLFFGGDGAHSLEYLERAHRKVPPHHHEVSNEIELHLALARQMDGKAEEAWRIVEALLVDLDSYHPIRQTRLLAALVFSYVIADDLTNALNHSGLLQHVAREGDCPYALAWGYYMQGLVHFRRRELLEAEEYFGRAVEDRYNLHRRAVADAMVGLVLTRQDLGRPDEADSMLEELQEYARTHADAAALLLAESGRQRLALQRGEPTLGLPQCDETPVTEAMIFWLEIPDLTHCRCLVAEGSPASLERAERKLRECLAFNESQHNVRHQIEILPLLALVAERRGQRDEALALLECAVSLAARGGSVRPFLEPGRAVAELLRRLQPETANQAFVRQVLEAFDGIDVVAPLEPMVLEPPAPPGRPAEVPVAIEELTDRELEILELLAERFQNKEIASRLFISIHTVNDHLKHVYQKLGVHGRRQAVLRAREMGLLGAR